MDLLEIPVRSEKREKKEKGRNIILEYTEKYGRTAKGTERAKY